MNGPDRPFLVVCFGDSITGHLPGEPYRHLYLKWSDLLELMLEARLGLADCTRRVIALSLGIIGVTAPEKM